MVKQVIMCYVEGCGAACDSHSGKGLCGKHYKHLLRHGSLTEKKPDGRRKPKLLCSVSGCERMKKSRGLCEKHYFRQRRYGTTELTSHGKRRHRLENSAGYQKINARQHPLADSTGYVYEHRMIIYDLHGDVLPNCAICDRALTWQSCHIDHVDGDTKNNNMANIRPVCCGCNTWRTNRAEHTYKHRVPLTINGVTMTVKEWSRHADVTVSASTVYRRLRSGMSPVDALLSPKVTHKNSVSLREETKYAKTATAEIRQ